MSNTFVTLNDFLSKAENSRKYPKNTVYGMKAAINLFEQEATDEEKLSIDVFTKNISAVYQSVFTKNKTLSAGSIQTYYKRLKKLIADYGRYGTDPTKMANWNPKVIIRLKKNQLSESKPVIDNSNNQMPSENLLNSGVDYDKYEISLRPNSKAVLITPSDITKSEIEKIKDYLDYKMKYAPVDK